MSPLYRRPLAVGIDRHPESGAASGPRGRFDLDTVAVEESCAQQFLTCGDVVAGTTQNYFDLVGSSAPDALYVLVAFERRGVQSTHRPFAKKVPPKVPPTASKVPNAQCAFLLGGETLPSPKGLPKPGGGSPP